MYGSKTEKNYFTFEKYSITYRGTFKNSIDYDLESYEPENKLDFQSSSKKVFPLICTYREYLGHFY